MKPEVTVEDVLDIFEQKHIRSVPVVDTDGKLAGLCGLRHILRQLLPASVTMEDGLKRLDFVIGAAPGIAKRLNKIRDVKVEEVMDKNPIVLHPDTPTWEALRVIALHGSPVPIVDEKTGQFVGMISSQTLLRELQNMTKK